MQVILELIIEMCAVFFVQDFYETISNKNIKLSKRKLIFTNIFNT